MIRKNTSGVITTYPPQTPSTVAATITTPSTSEEAATVTEDTVSTTVAQAEATGAKTLIVDSATGITTKRLYKVGTQVVEVKSITGTTLTLTEPLLGPVADGAVFEGMAYFAAYTTDHTSDEGTGRIRWISDLDTWDQAFEITEQTRFYALRAPRLTSRYSIVHDLRSPDDDDLTEALDAGWYKLERDLRAQGLDMDLIRSWDYLEDAHATAVVVQLLRNNSRYDEDFKNDWDADYLAARSSALASKRFWYDEDDDKIPEDNGITDRKGWSL